MSTKIECRLAMRKLRSTFALLAFLFLGLSLVVPAEDLVETSYDESETQPCERAPLISDLLLSAAASATEQYELPTGRQSASPCRATATRTDETDGHRSAQARVVLALLCTLLC